MASNPENRQQGPEKSGNKRSRDWHIPGGKLLIVEEEFANRATRLRPARVSQKDMALPPEVTAANEKIIYEVD